MSSIQNLEIVKTVSNDARVETKKSWLGMHRSYRYKPTGSLLQAIQRDYSNRDGSRVESVLNLEVERLEDELQNLFIIPANGLGNVHLEMCLSSDEQFAALRLYRFYNFQFHPVTELLYFEGPVVKSLSKAFK